MNQNYNIKTHTIMYIVCFANWQSKKIKRSVYYADLLIKIFYDKERHVDTMDTSTTSKLYS